MKIRNGFVSNSSSSCFVCGDWIGESETICGQCHIKQIIELVLDEVKKLYPNVDIKPEEMYDVLMKGDDDGN